MARGKRQMQKKLVKGMYIERNRGKERPRGGDM